MESVPVWMVPILNILQDRAKESPAVLQYGVFDEVKYLSTESDIEFGIYHGLGVFGDVTFNVNREPMGSNYCVVVFRKMRDGVDLFTDAEHAVNDKAYEEGPDHIEEIANLIWNYYAARKEKPMLRRFKVV